MHQGNTFVMIFREILKKSCLAFGMRPTIHTQFRAYLYNVKLTTMRLFSSSFQPAPPPGTDGTPVFPNINFSVASDSQSEGNRRKNDPNAVFVVTGASRGIGLQFVKSLAENYQVSCRSCWCSVLLRAQHK